MSALQKLSKPYQNQLFINSSNTEITIQKKQDSEKGIELWTSIEKSLCLRENFQMIKNVKLFYLKISKKPFAALVKENSPQK